MAQNLTNKSRLLEKYSQVVREDGLNTNKNVNVGINGASAALWVSGNVTSGGTVSATGGVSGAVNNPVVQHPTSAAINSTASATAAQVATGYITSTSAAAVTITMPTATAIATAIGAKAGTVFDLIIDNTAGSNTVTMSMDASEVASTVAAVATYGVPTFGLLTVASGTSGTGRFTFVFSSATACTYTRTA